MEKLQNNSLVITTLLTFAILTTMTVVDQQVYGIDLGPIKIDKGGVRVDINPEDPAVGNLVNPGNIVTDPGNILQNPSEAIPDMLGDASEGLFGYRSEQDFTDDYKDDGHLQKFDRTFGGDILSDIKGQANTEFTVPITFTIPTPVPLGATVILTGDLKKLKDTDVQFSIAGFTPKDVSFEDYTIKQHYDASIEQIVNDLSGGTITEIGPAIAFIEDYMGIDVRNMAHLTMDLSVQVPIPKSVNDLSQIKKLVPRTSLIIEGCTISGQENDIDAILEQGSDEQQISDLDAILEQGSDEQAVNFDLNKASNTEDDCTQLFST